MALTDEDAASNPLIMSADAHNVAGGKTSWVEELGKAATYGVFGAGVSGISGIVNTAIAGINWATNANIEKMNVESTLRSFDDDLANYYVQNKEGIDIAGFVGSSLVPGMLGIKALRLMQSGGHGANGYLATGLFKNKHAELLLKAKMDIADSTNTFKVLTATRAKMLGAGFGNEALEAAAFELAVVATMNQSPMLDQMSAKDIFWNALGGMALGGVIGGSIQGGKDWWKLRSVTKEVDAGDFIYRHNSYLAGNATPEKNIILLAGSKFRRPVDGTDKQLQLALEANNTADNLIGIEAQKLAGGDAALGNALREQILASKSVDEVADNLANLKSLERITLADAPKQGTQFTDPGKNVTRLFRAEAAKGAEELGEGSAAGGRWFTSNLEEAKGYLQKDYPDGKIVYVDVPTQLAERYKASTYGATLADGLEPAQFARKPNIEYFVDPLYAGRKKPLSSAAILAGDDDATSALIVNFKTGEYLTRAMPTVVDLAKNADEIKRVAQGLRIGDKIYTKAATALNPLTDDALDLNARHIYTLLDETPLGMSATISKYDIPMLEKALRDNTQLVYIAEGSRALRSVEALSDYIAEVKSDLALQMIKKNMDELEIAYRLNITPEFLTDVSKGYIREGLDEARSFLKPTHGRMVYDTASINTDGNVLRGEALVNAQILKSMQSFENVFANMFSGEAGVSAIPSPEELYYLIRDASREGAGAGFISFASGEYGSIASMAERIGSFVDRASKAKIDEVTKQVTSTLAPILRDEKLTAELSFIKSMVQRSPEKFMLDRANNQLVMHDAIEKWVKGADGSLVPILKEDYAPVFAGTPIRLDVSKDVYAFLEQHININEGRRTHYRNARAARGLGDVTDAEKRGLPLLYFPPVNTRDFKFFALVRQHDGIGAQPHVGVIVSQTAEGLSAKIDEMSRRPEFQRMVFMRQTGKDTFEGKHSGQVITKFDSKLYHQARGDYEYSLGLNENFVDTSLRRAGALSDVIPPAGKGASEKISTEFMEWHMREEIKLVREGVEMRYAHTTEELRQLGLRYGAVESSQFRSVAQSVVDSADNPYNDIIKTMLNISRSSEYGPWRSINTWVEDSVSKSAKIIREGFIGLGKFGDAEATAFNKMASDYGLGQPYRDGMERLLANEIAEKPYLGRFVAKAQAILSGTILGLDPLNALNNIVGTPILYSSEMSHVLRAIKNGNADVVGQLAGLREVIVPGTNGKVAMPTTWKLLGNSIKMYFEDARAGGVLLNEFRNMNVVSDFLYQHRQMLDNLTVRGNETAAALDARVTSALELGSKITGNKFSEEFTRFVAAASMKQLTDIATTNGLMSSREAAAYIQTFTNRVAGNYLASQRPIVFQGVIGQAIGLFQTYQFNLLQNLLRYVSTEQSRGAINLLMMQGTIYGLQGLPGFHAINTHLVGNADGNPAHKDIYHAAYSVAGKEAGDWLLYGLASNALGLLHPDLKFNLYSRGDINPRQITVLPVDPAEIPLVKATAGFFGNLLDTASKLSKGGEFKDTILQGLEHNGLNRPLAGIAQVLNGYTTTSKGSLLSSIDLFDISNAARMAGGKPFDEAVALDALYRIKAYQAKDRARREKLGSAIKTTLVAGGNPSDDEVQDFALAYAKSGGRQDQFSKFMVTQMRMANTSQVNVLRDKLNNPLAQGLQEIMGGERLPDFMSGGTTRAEDLGP